MTENLRVRSIVYHHLIPLVVCAVVSVSCSDLGVEPIRDHSPSLKGVSYTSFGADGFLQGTRSNAVGGMVAELGNEWVALCVTEYQSSSTTHDIAPNTTGRNPVDGSVWSTTSTMDDVGAGARDARQHGLKILLNPHVDLYTGEWRAAIRPDSAWFTAYTAMLRKYARFADSLGIEMLCIGTEFVVATQPQFTGQWRGIIAAIRSEYAGKLTYAANWNGAETYGVSQAEFTQVQFWDNLDYIGVDSYWPVTSSPTDPQPTIEVGVSVMLPHAIQIGNVAAQFHRPVILTETGLQSVRGALASPWDFSLGNSASAVEDDDAQAFYYRVVIESIGKQSWCEGIFWWSWESVPSPNAAFNYTPRNKPAATVVSQWYRAGTIL